MHPHVSTLLRCIELEEKEQSERYRLDQQHSLRTLKAEGLALHPIIVTRKSFGYADYPEISFRISFPPEQNYFRDGAAIECFLTGEEPIRGVLLNLDGKSGEFRLFAPDFPDWMEEDGVGIKLAPDTRTTEIMKRALADLEKNKPMFQLFQRLHDQVKIKETLDLPSTSPVNFSNQGLNHSQREAVSAIMFADDLTIVHGPPGTGKTTTLVEAIVQLTRRDEKILVAAPSNAAIDHISKQLIEKGIRLLRVGNANKTEEAIYAHTPEGRLANSKLQKEIKQLKQRAEEFRRMALKYKRSFGKAEREQRQLLFKEVRNIREEIRKLQAYNEEKLFEEAQVIAGTPIGIYDAGVQKLHFSTLVLDEAGQCIEPLAWCIFPLAEKIILAGDHLQLSPTVLSNEASRLGFNRSILEWAVTAVPSVNLLNTQYRMKKAIAGFSSRYFYGDQLITPGHLNDTGTHLVFIDTAGSGNQESQGPDGSSLQNEGEIDIAMKLIEQEKLAISSTAFVSPYSGQVAAAKTRLPAGLRISTIDSFQGQEKDAIILSLVRSNEEGDIGFLKDYRRMNVAITRAREKLFVIGDSATIGADPFYRAFLEYAESIGSYQTIWEFNW